MIRILIDVLTTPAKLIELATAAMSSDEIRKILRRANRLAGALKGSPGEQARAVRELVEKILVAEDTILIRVRRSLVGGDVAPSGRGDPIELTAAVAFKRRGVETKMMLTKIFGFRPSVWNPTASLNGILPSTTRCSWLPQSSMATGFSDGPP